MKKIPLGRTGFDSTTKTMLSTFRFPGSSFQATAPRLRLRAILAIHLGLDRGDGRPIAFDDVGRHKSPDLWRLPEILELRIRWRRFQHPRRVTVEGKDSLYSQAVEIELRVSESIHIRALGPVLWVGAEPLTIADNPSKNAFRFYAFAPDALRADAPLALSWNSPGADRKPTKDRYVPPERE